MGDDPFAKERGQGVRQAFRLATTPHPSLSPGGFAFGRGEPDSRSRGCQHYTPMPPQILLLT